MKTRLLAFHGKPSIKRKYLARVKAHRLADDIKHGFYWEKGKGCAVGCTVHSSSHAAYEEELGIPRTLAQLEDRIFESMTNGDAQQWPEQFLSAPRVGADLSMVWPRFALWLLTNPDGPVVKAASKHQNVKAAVEGVGALYAEWVESGRQPAPGRWQAARDAAAYAAADAADAAAYAAAYAATYAAYAAATYAAAYAAAARGAFWMSARDKLLQLMRDAPVKRLVKKGK